MAEAVTIPEPPWPIDAEQLFELLREHRRAPLVLMGADGCSRTLNDDEAALVTVLLRLSQEAILIHHLAKAEPDRPVAQVLTEAVRQLRWS